MDRLRKARTLLNLLFLWTKADVSRLKKSFVWCRRPDSNRHVFLRLILNQLRLPISPLRHGRDAENVVDYTCHAPPCKCQHAIVSLSVEKNSVIALRSPTLPPCSSYSHLSPEFFRNLPRKKMQRDPLGLHLLPFTMRCRY